MNVVFKPYLRHFSLVFFDDILVFSSSLTDHVIHLRVVLEVLFQHNLYAKITFWLWGERVFGTQYFWP